MVHLCAALAFGCPALRNHRSCMATRHPRPQPRSVESVPEVRLRPDGPHLRSRLPGVWYALGVKPHPKIRKTVKWGGAAVTVLLAVLWYGSGRWFIASCASTNYNNIVELARGGIQVLWQRPLAMPPKLIWKFASSNTGFEWWIGFVGSWSTNWQLAIPLWIPVVPTLLVTMLAWHLDVRARRPKRTNPCPSCGYDRTGLAPSAVCPECGTPSNG